MAFTYAQFALVWHLKSYSGTKSSLPLHLCRKDSVIIHYLCSIGCSSEISVEETADDDVAKFVETADRGGWLKLKRGTNLIKHSLTSYKCHPFATF